METDLLPAWNYNLKMLVLMTTISVPNFLLVSKSAQFKLKFTSHGGMHTVHYFGKISIMSKQ